MPTTSELVRAVLVPLLAAFVIAAAGAWRRQAWAMPAAVGVGFLAGYASLLATPSPFVPSPRGAWMTWPALPPADGTDWLFWLAIPATLLGATDAAVRPRHGWLAGVVAGAVAAVLLAPLSPHRVTASHVVAAATVLGAVGAAVVLVVQVAEPRVGARATTASLAVVVGAAAVVVLSSNIRTTGVYGFAAAAALTGVAAAIRASGAGDGAARGTAVVAAPLLVGLLVSGRYYADPGVTALNFVALLAAPAFMLVALLVPAGRAWLSGAVALLVTAVAAAAVAGPAALKAKREAEAQPDDPYARAYR